MKIATRFLLVSAFLGIGLLGQVLLRWHVAEAGPLEPVGLDKSLAEMPYELGPWRGVDQPIEKESLLYGDDHLQRVYMHMSRQQRVTLWMIYSGTGADRGHHPEVCMAVAGKPEDTSARRTCELSGEGAPVQQYRFGRPGDYQWVYYWHYTLPSSDNNQLSSIQKFYRRLRQKPSSMTIEVFAPEFSQDDPEFASEFVRLVDEAVQAHVGTGAIRGSERHPVTIIAGE
jgi:hypothetical protein